ncbi:tripartite tricarboxylate transporter TctB family protein [Microbacterium marinilacus]|uniref:Tripartite tricarboxylate transporter TctB n=1 Tax=Microbacterium marinilacus TaxID=415209 RepID=A0ABP7BRL8_9MICO|nr:tripartite tricarboxylate transporter TctB family protein [Microbacterium marinilacus]MBY0689144.1 tripartite tricarboxylate transporter TctB family protein [Microbacterium marinilacus]
MTGIVRLVPHARGRRLSDGFWRRRTGLIAPAIMLLISGALVYGIVTMEIPENISFPGPTVFPSFVAAACAIIAVLLAIDVIRKPEAADVASPADTSLEATPSALDEDDLAFIADVQKDEAEAEPSDEAAVRTRSNVRSLLSAVGVVVVFIAALTPVGWLLSGAFLFWGVSWALGSRRPVFDIFLAVAVSSIVQLAFSAGLGLSLPPGILAGVI